jgi:hypothetical protein
MLRAAVAGTDQDEHRIKVFHGSTPPDKRKQIKQAFNAPDGRSFAPIAAESTRCTRVRAANKGI